MIRRMKSLVPIKALVILSILLFVIVLPIISWNLQYSSYFIQGDLNYAAYKKRLENNYRISVSRTIMNDFERSSIMPFNYLNFNSNIPVIDKLESLGIIIPAVNRDTRKIDAYEPKYLTQSTAYALQAVLNDLKNFGKRWSNISIVMCNIDDYPERFSEYNLLRRYFESLQIDKINSQDITNNNCKAKTQFISCVHEAHKKLVHVNKFVFIEDDMLFKKDGINGISNIFQSLEKRFNNDVAKKLGYVQLYYPYDKVRYSILDSNSLLEILLLSTGLMLILLTVYFRLKLRAWMFWYNFSLICALMLISTLCIVLIGRAHWRSIYHAFTKSYSLIEPIHPSAAAIMFDRNFLRIITDKFDGKTISCIDDAKEDAKLNFLNELCKEKNLRVLSVNMNLFQHIGLYSFIKKSIINPHIVD